jgi:hypothetical protein
VRALVRLLIIALYVWRGQMRGEEPKEVLHPLDWAARSLLCGRNCGRCGHGARAAAVLAAVAGPARAGAIRAATARGARRRGRGDAPSFEHGGTERGGFKRRCFYSENENPGEPTELILSGSGQCRADGSTPSSTSTGRTLKILIDAELDGEQLP